VLLESDATVKDHDSLRVMHLIAIEQAPSVTNPLLHPPKSI
jgi:hypothetical protein